MKALPLVLLTSLLLLTAGCESNDPKAKMRRTTREYTEAADLLATVRDQASFEAARPKLKKHFAWVREQNREVAAQQNQSADPKAVEKGMKEFETLSKEPEFKALMDASMRYAGEMLRVQAAVPGFTQFYNQEVNGR